MKRLVIGILVLGALVALASTCFVVVDQTEFAIIKQFGKPVRTILEPGLQIKWPAPIQSVVRLDNRLQVFEDPAPDAPAKEYLTRDKKNIEVSSFTCWRIAPQADAVLKYIQTVRDHVGVEAALGDIVKSQFNAKLGAADFEELVSTDESRRRWQPIMAEIRDKCAARAAADYGIEIVDVRVLRLSFPPQNRRSVFERMRAERERIAKQFRSEGEAAAMRIRAEAMAEQERIRAESFAEAEALRGKADAEATRIYGEAYSAAPEFYKFLRTLESYEKGIDRGTILILPAESDFFRLLTNPDAEVDELPEPTLTEPVTSHGQANPQPAADPEG